MQLPESEIEAIDTLPKLQELKTSSEVDLKARPNSTVLYVVIDTFVNMAWYIIATFLFTSHQ